MFPWRLGPCLFVSVAVVAVVASTMPEFQVHCNDGVPYLGYYKRGFRLQILSIFYSNGSLLVSDVHKLGDFSYGSTCHVPTANTASKIGPQFSISLLNQNLIFYKCTKKPPGTAAGAGLADTVCRNNTFVRAGGRYNASGRIDRGYALPGCNATAVPVLGASGEVNASEAATTRSSSAMASSSHGSR